MATIKQGPVYLGYDFIKGKLVGYVYDRLGTRLSKNMPPQFAKRLANTLNRSKQTTLHGTPIIYA